MTLRHLFLSILCATGMIHAGAMPAAPTPFVYTQPDGTTLTLRLLGDEHAHVYLMEDGREARFDEAGFVSAGECCDAATWQHRLARRRQQARLQAREQAQPRRVATTGQAKGLIVLVNFADLAFEDEALRIQRQMNETGYKENGATGSARDYFTDQSMGLFTPQFDVVGPVTLDFPYRYYGSNRNDDDAHDNAPKEMVFEAVKSAVSQGMAHLDDYDSDHDGYVDMVYVIYAGKGEADGGDPNTIWPHMSDMQGDAQWAFQSIDGKRLALYACSAEKRGDGTFSGIGTFCHEYGHCLGLPDLYDVDYSGGFGMGDFDIMSGGGYLNKGNTPPCYSAFERYSLGWLEYIDIESSGSIDLPPLPGSNIAYRLTSPHPNEYFTLENRQYDGWDLYLPGRGLMITHIDYDETIWEDNEVNDDPDHPHVRLMAADNTWSRTTENGDLYPGTFDNHTFSDSSTPAALLWDGSSLGKSLSHIQLSGMNVTFDVEVETDGIETITANEEDDVYYSIEGVRVGRPVKPGLYIKNGKKILNVEF